MRVRIMLGVSLMVMALQIAGAGLAAGATPATYYVSSSGGNDSYNGLSAGAPFASVSKVNGLNLQPGDRVLFKCGDVWRADPLVISHAGTSGAPITFSSYPASCANKPIFSGARPISGWTLDTGNVYRADLATGANAFPLGINQLFRNGQRLTLGRWPNLDAPSAGYSFVDAHSAGGSMIGDNQLPGGDWTGAIVHIKNIRWSMLDRQVISSASHTLNLNTGLSCLVESWGSCQGWGFFINNARNTLDEDGEWFYDAGAKRVYLYSSSGLPSNMEGSVVQAAWSGRDSGVMLSNGAATAYVNVDNLIIKNWFNDGIGTPGGMFGDIYHHLTVSNVTVQDVNGAGVNLSSWLQNPPDGRRGLRGGHDLTFTHDIIDGANSFGVTGYFASSTFTNNTIENIALVKNLGQSGMGCGLTTGECTENGDGFRIRSYDTRDSGHDNTLRQNTFDKTGYNGVDVFGPNTLLENNFITRACYTKADCGAVRTFGDNDLATTPVYNIQLLNNVIVDIPGNVDGAEASRAAFGMGLYIDNYSRNVTASGNTVVSTTVTGILFQQSTGQITGNTVFNAASGTEFSGQIEVSGSAAQASLSHNAVYGLTGNAWTLYVSGLSNLTASDQNDLFQPYVNHHVAYGPGWTQVSFAQWQATSGQDTHSKTNWFTQTAGTPSRGKVFYNPTAAAQIIDLGNRQYLDLDQAPVVGSLTLQAFSSKILVDNGVATLTLQGLAPALAAASAATNFTLTVTGTGFTPSSVVRWAGSNRPTTLSNSTHLTAAITAADVSAVGAYPVTVRDGGTETPAVMFHVVPQVYSVALPMMAR